MTFAATQTLTALAALAFLVFFTRLIEVLPPILRATHESFRGLVLAQFVTSALAMLPTAVVFGFNFPAAALLIVGRQTSPPAPGQWAAPTRGIRSARSWAPSPPDSGCCRAWEVFICWRRRRERILSSPPFFRSSPPRAARGK